ncbi:MAG: hypothetical protein Q9170_004774 [Blastenia crenularia]
MNSSPSPASTPSPHSSAANLLAPPQSSPAPPSVTNATSEAENEDPHPKAFRPRLAFADTSGQDGRRPSVQFLPAQTEQKVRTASPKPSSTQKVFPPKIQRRLSSPPPPSKYERRVSFNTFDNRDATDFAFTISTKHKDYHYTQRSRTFLCGTDDNDYSYDAIEWLIEELVEDGDEIICLRVVDKDSKFASDASLRNETYKKEAEQLLEKIKNKNKDKGDGEKEKAIGLAIEFAVGKVPEVFQRMITVYAPACLIVGTKGKTPSTGLTLTQSFVTGSVSRYCLQNSPVPCIVVRPTRKRIAKKAKRLADGKRRNYANVLEKSGPPMSVLGPLGSEHQLVPSGGVENKEASEKEAKAVAAAIGIPARSLSKMGKTTPPLPPPPLRGGEEEGVSLSRTRTESVGPDSPSPTGAFVVSEENSPEFEPLDSPVMSDEEGEGQEEREEEGMLGLGTKKEAEEERRGRTISQESDGKRTGAKKFVFPKERRKSEDG